MRGCGVSFRRSDDDELVAGAHRHLVEEHGHEPGAAMAASINERLRRTSVLDSARPHGGAAARR